MESLNFPKVRVHLNNKANQKDLKPRAKKARCSPEKERNKAKKNLLLKNKPRVCREFKEPVKEKKEYSAAKMISLMS